MEVISQAYAKSPETAKILATLSIKNTHGDYSIHEGVIRLRGKILVPPDVEMQMAIIRTLHTTAVGGHSGAFVTYQKVKQLFTWSKMKTMITKFVAECQVCQQAKLKG